MLPNEILIIVFEFAVEELQMWLEIVLKNRNFTEALFVVTKLTYKPQDFLIDDLVQNNIGRDYDIAEWILKHIGKPSFELLHNLRYYHPFLRLLMKYNLLNKNELAILFGDVIRHFIAGYHLNFDSNEFLNSFIKLGLGPHSFKKDDFILIACKSTVVFQLQIIEWLMKNGFAMPEIKAWRDMFFQAARNQNKEVMSWILNRHLITECFNHDIGILKKYKCNVSIDFIQKHLPIRKKQRIA